MKNSTINSKTIKELTDFLPIIYDDKIEVAKGPKKGEADLFGGYHIYHPSIEKFFELASQQYWQDYQYVERPFDSLIFYFPYYCRQKHNKYDAYKNYN